MPSLEDRLTDAWKRVNEAKEAVEPILLARIAEVVRGHHADAVALWLEPTDQNFHGWTLCSAFEPPVELANGERVEAADEVQDGLWPHLDDLGAEFLPSDATSYPYRLELQSEVPEGAPTTSALLDLAEAGFRDIAEGDYADSRARSFARRALADLKAGQQRAYDRADNHYAEEVSDDS